MIIAVGGSRGKRQFDCVRRPIQSSLAYLEVDYVGGLFVNQVDEKGAILERPEALQQVFRLGRELAGSRGPLPDRPVHIKLL
jgi:aryl-alcohol dehydrogenase-like predicted oxidoreductase